MFPLVAMCVGRGASAARRRRRGRLLFIAYLFWLCAGFMGLHRFYLQSCWGFVFMPVFLLSSTATR